MLKILLLVFVGNSNQGIALAELHSFTDCNAQGRAYVTELKKHGVTARFECKGLGLQNGK